MTMSATTHTTAAPPPPTSPDSSDPMSESYVYPRGHLGHLSQYESQALDDFKRILEERGYWNRGPPASHDDPLLLRYLRARKWIAEEAFTQFKDTEEWRKANDIEVLYKTIDIDAYEQCRQLYPQWTGRRDRRGIPLYVFEIRTLDSKTVSEYERSGSKTTFSQAKTDGTTSPGLLRLFALYENLTRFNMPLCTQLPDRQHPDVPITMSTNIVDISGVGLKQFWNLKNHMQAASVLATAHYPETLDRIFVVGAPSFFSTVWGWVKRWFDPMTVSKIFILAPEEVSSTLEEFIDSKDIPKKYGGELNYVFGQLSVPDPGWEGVIAWEEGYSSFPSGPLLWEETGAEGGELVCVRLGSKDGVQVNERICTVPRSWPYVKSGSVATDETVVDKQQQQQSGEATEKIRVNGENETVSAALAA